MNSRLLRNLKLIKRKIKELYIHIKFGEKIKSVYIPLNKKYNNKTIIGKNARLSKEVELIEDVVIGDYTYINDPSYIQSCVTGKYCSIASGVSIGMTEHPLTYVSTHPILYDKQFGFINKDKKVNDEITIIGNDVWIGKNAIILR